MFAAQESNPEPSNGRTIQYALSGPWSNYGVFTYYSPSTGIAAEAGENLVECFKKKFGSLPSNIEITDGSPSPGRDRSDFAPGVKISPNILFESASKEEPVIVRVVESIEGSETKIVGLLYTPPLSTQMCGPAEYYDFATMKSYQISLGHSRAVVSAESDDEATLPQLPNE